METLFGFEELTVEEKWQKFLERYKRNVRPYSEYAEYFKSSALPPSYFFKSLENNFKHFVIGKGWSEVELVVAIHETINNGFPISFKSLEITNEKIQRNFGKRNNK